MSGTPNFSTPLVVGRKRERSPSPQGNDDNTVPTATFVKNAVFRPKPTTEGNTVAKRQRGDLNQSTRNHTQEQSAAAPVSTPNDPAPINDTNTALVLAEEPTEPIAKRLRKRKAPVDPFIPRKPKPVATALAVRRQRQDPVFGQNSMALLPADQAQLAAALVRPQTIITRSAVGFPVAHVPNESKIVRPRVAKGPTQTVRHCLCKNPYDENMVVCTGCDDFFHPVCVGKGLQSPEMYIDEQLASRAYTRDAQEYGKMADFRCSACDKTKPKPKPASRSFSWAEANAEQIRRTKIFQTRNDIAHDGTVRECDHCTDEIIGVRYECRFCEGFDLCRTCFFDPSVSSLHQHSEGGMVLK
ncbi:hypothetical protein Q7P37_010790 [Cladosporium fusiforme]